MDVNVLVVTLVTVAVVWVTVVNVLEVTVLVVTVVGVVLVSVVTVAVVFVPVVLVPVVRLVAVAVVMLVLIALVAALVVSDIIVRACVELMVLIPDTVEFIAFITVVELGTVTVGSICPVAVVVVVKLFDGTVLGKSVVFCTSAIDEGAIGSALAPVLCMLATAPPMAPNTAAPTTTLEMIIARDRCSIHCF